ncbi:MAG: Rieske (2Fe-2S) protein [Acidobacteriota bacterium]|jgi:cytochrome b6-f complex iron-sulfur subunit
MDNVKKKRKSKNKNEKAEEPKQPQRRSFLARAVLLLGVLAGLEAGWITSSFLRPREESGTGDAGGIVVAGPIERFEPGSVTAFRAGKFYLVRLDDGGFLALYRKCTHLGCTVPWIEDEGRFACPCHASAFDRHGDVLNAPATRPLDLFAVRIENGIVKVDTSRTVRRDAYRPDQVTRA